MPSANPMRPTHTCHNGLRVAGAELVDVVDRRLQRLHQLQRQRQAPVLVLVGGRPRQAEHIRRVLAAEHLDACSTAGTIMSGPQSGRNTPSLSRAAACEPGAMD